MTTGVECRRLRTATVGGHCLGSSRAGGNASQLLQLLLQLPRKTLVHLVKTDLHLQEWINTLLLLPRPYQLTGSKAHPWPAETQRLVIRLFLRLSLIAKLYHREDGALQCSTPRHRERLLGFLPPTAALDLMLCFEPVDSAGATAAARGLALQMGRRDLSELVRRLRQLLPATVDAAARRLRSLSKHRTSHLCNTTGLSSETACAPYCNAVSAVPWEEAVGKCLSELWEAVATLRAATLVLPHSEALNLWTPGMNHLRSSDRSFRMEDFLRGPSEGEVSAVSPLELSLWNAYAALACAPWSPRQCVPTHVNASFPGRSEAPTPVFSPPPELLLGVSRARRLCCCCCVGWHALRSFDVRLALKQSSNRNSRGGHLLMQKAEGALQEWAHCLVQFYEEVSASESDFTTLSFDLCQSGAASLLKQWKQLDVHPDQLEHIECLLEGGQLIHAGFHCLVELVSTTECSVQMRGENATCQSTGSPPVVHDVPDEGKWGLCEVDTLKISRLKELFPSVSEGYLYLLLATQVGDEAQALDILLEGSKPKEMEQIEVDITLQDAAEVIKQWRAVGSSNAIQPRDVELGKIVIKLSHEHDCYPDKLTDYDSMYDDDADEDEVAESLVAPVDVTESPSDSLDDQSGSEAPSGVTESSIRGKPLVPGRSWEARRRTANKKFIGNHDRRSRQIRKVQRCMV